MNSNNQISSGNINNVNSIAWYRVPIMWFMVIVLSLTVVSGIYMFVLASNTKDTVVIDKDYEPLNKKQANPSIPVNKSSNKSKTRNIKVITHRV